MSEGQICKGCGGEIIFFSSMSGDYDIETPVCSKCGRSGGPIRTEYSTKNIWAMV